ncbi:hypothetical protein N7466_002241 [Penicillium verhagenii]|uniref:uncharacterized protein n=1 Tax=Penicillium verhagenii TaxID=1562060 RepID=UPI002544FAAF|nr:uncharacterized protein N7466_002241 [Penicillium verhagenii]KAJ5939107.1 hypothetical protein N7466_002241 [Penicillium verhagenii]
MDPLLVTLEDQYLNILGILAAYTVFHFLIYPLFLSPLSKIPGPKLTALSSWYLDIKYLQERASSHVEELHRQYGPIVRVGPSEIVINDSKNLATIYGVSSAFPKPPAAARFDNFGYPCAFSSRYKNEHRERRRATAKVYTMSSIMGNESLLNFIRNRLDKVTRLIDDDAGSVTDLFAIAIRFALDNVTFMVLGESFLTLDGKNVETTKSLSNNLVIAAPMYRLQRMFEILSFWPLKKLLSRDLQYALRGNHSDFDNVVKEKFDHAFANASELKDEKSTLGWADTTGASIIYMLHTLALPEHKAYQDRLRSEICTLPYPFSFKDVCSLPFLECCAREILRMYSPGPGSIQQRCTPASTRTAITVGDKVYHLPGNTQIGIQQFSLHRNVEIYGDDVDTFSPARWETKNEERLQAMKDAWIPFGYGSRICVGIKYVQHVDYSKYHLDFIGKLTSLSLATVELKMMTATLLHQYDVRLPNGARREDMAPVLGAVIRPKSGKCKLLFRKLSK